MRIDLEDKDEEPLGPFNLSEEYFNKFMGDNPTKLKVDLYTICLLNAQRKMLETNLSNMRHEKKKIGEKIKNLLRLEAKHPCCQIKDDSGVPTVRIRVFTEEDGLHYICDGCNQELK